MLLGLGEHIDFACDTPVHAFDICTCAQVYKTMAEQVQTFFADLLCIVPVLQQSTWVKIIPYFVHVLDQLVGILLRFEVFVHAGQGCCFQNLHDEYGMMG